MERIKVLTTGSEGVAMGEVFIAKPFRLLPEEYSIREPEEEIEKLNVAIADASHELEEVKEHADLFSTYSEITKDILLSERIIEKIKGQKMNVQRALWESTAELITMFETMDNAYLSERASDIRDVRNRLMCHLKGVSYNPFSDIKTPVIIIAEDLTPSDTTKLKPELTLGFITSRGGITSHVSIIAGDLGIPALVGVTDILKFVTKDSYVIMDAKEGDIIIDPNEEQITFYEEKRELLKKETALYEEASRKNAVTMDGKEIKVMANVGSVREVKEANAMGVYGVGLFRTELLYMESTHFPSEEEQFAIYKEAVKLCKEGVVFRTLDIGGDKSLHYFGLEKEDNPFLGWRAIRISLDMKEMFKCQLRAILRASAYGTVSIMFPMIVSLEEMVEARALVTECEKELKKEGKAFDSELKIGMMVETPAAVLLSEQFAEISDFFSIGTNDLAQYLLVVDRGNKKVADRYPVTHPAVLKAITTVIESGHKKGIEVGMCGEMAGNFECTEALVKMGLDFFSMSPLKVSKTKYLISNCLFNN